MACLDFPHKALAPFPHRPLEVLVIILNWLIHSHKFIHIQELCYHSSPKIYKSYSKVNAKRVDLYLTFDLLEVDRWTFRHKSLKSLDTIDLVN